MSSTKLFTLVYIKEGERCLLGLKKRGFGQGKWNGFGGKVQQGEGIVDAAVREVQEECGLQVKQADLQYLARIRFEFQGDPVQMEVHVFLAETFSGEVMESSEMKPEWFRMDGLPYCEMWADDVLWHPLFFNKIKFHAYFLFQGTELILSHTITPQPDLMLPQ